MPLTVKLTLNYVREQIQYDDLIIACGSKPNKFGWKGQDLPLELKACTSWQDLGINGKKYSQSNSKML